MRKILLASLFLLIFCKGFAQCPTSLSSTPLNVNNVNAAIDNAGSLWSDLSSSKAAYTVPKGDSVNALFEGGLWIGGLDNFGQLRMAASTYRQNGNDFSPGPLDSKGVPVVTTFNFDTVWAVYRTTIDSFTGGLFKSIPPSIKNWPAKGNPNLPNLPGQDLAPFVDVAGTGLYDPSKGDYPLINGDESTWEVFNDACSPHGETSCEPMNIEVHLMAFAYFAPNYHCLNNATFYHYDIINKDNIASYFDSTYFSAWVDPDLGCSLDDYVGCVPNIDMGVCYNGEAIDGPCTPNYGKHPPMVAIQMVDLPKDANGDSIHMDDFVYYNNDFTSVGNPTSCFDYYNYMKAIWPDGTHFTYGGDGDGGIQPYNYIFPSDPTDTSSGAWSECSAGNTPGDRRFIMSFGPQKFSKGQTFSYTYSVIFDDDTTMKYPCPSFSSIISTAQCASNLYHVFTGVQQVPLNSDQISIYPNPATNQLTVESGKLIVKEIKIVNVLGETVYMPLVLRPSSLTTIDVSALTPGIYFVTLTTDNKTITRKIVVQ